MKHVMTAMCLLFACFVAFAFQAAPAGYHTVKNGEKFENGDKNPDTKEKLTVENTTTDQRREIRVSPPLAPENGVADTTVEFRYGAHGTVKELNVGDSVVLGNSAKADVSGTGGKIDVQGNGAKVDIKNTYDPAAPDADKHIITVTLPGGGGGEVRPGETGHYHS